MEKILTLGHVGMGTGAVEPFNQIYKAGLLCRHLDDVNKCDALVIWGGADISPSIYHEPVGPRTGATEHLSKRDMVELAACKRAIERGIPIIGVCRGAQLLCAIAGGKLVQDVQNHGMTHNVTTKDGRSISTSSMHHQMMYPWAVEHELIAWAETPLSRDYEGVDIMPMWRDDDFFVEPEIVWFPKIKGLAIQGHPEFMDAKCEFVQYCMELVHEYILKEITCEC